MFEGCKPRYHSRLDCEKLSLSFSNFELPEEIINLGTNEIQKFRKWFKENQSRLETLDLFEARVRTAFPIQTSLKIVNFENSGAEEFKNFNLNELTTSIDDLIERIDSYYN